jgi:hypothetical protein
VPPPDPTDPPALSVVLRVIEGPAGVERCVRELRRQAGVSMLEILVPIARADASRLSAACQAAATVLLLEDGPGDPMAIHYRCDEGTARGLARSRGRIIASLEDATEPSATWVQDVLAAHDAWPDEAIGGTVDVTTDHVAAWAAFWLDFWKHVPPQPEGPVDTLSDVNVSYKRAAILAAQPVWTTSFNEFLVHRDFAARGFRMRRIRSAAVRILRPRRSWSAVLAERYAWGRVFGIARRRAQPASQTVAQLIAAPLMPFLVAARIGVRAFARPSHRAMLLRGVPALMLCSAAWCFGEWMGALRAR